MASNNPWTLVSAADYEGHMGPEGADQLRPLAAILARALRDLRPARLLVLGVATGNGLAAVDPEVTQRVVGLDLNLASLAVARQRHMRLGSRLELFCQDAEKAALPAASFDLVWAGLFLEHVDARAMARRIAVWLAPGGSLVAALQLPAAAGSAPGRTPPSMRAVADAMRLVPPEELGAELAGAGLSAQQAYEVAAGRGTRLHVGRWARPRAK
jgi:hypothetical protein